MLKTQTLDTLDDPKIENIQRFSNLASASEEKKAKHSKSTFIKVPEETTLMDLGSSTSCHNFNQIIS